MKDSVLEQTLLILQKGGLIAYPTDTIYGIGCDILAKEAVEKLYQIKKRPRHKPLILLASSIGMMKAYIPDLHPRIETLYVHHKQPLTIVSRAGTLVPDYLSTSQQTIGVRLVKNGFVHELIEQLGRPITSTSANISGEPFPESEKELNPLLLEDLDLVIPLSIQDMRTGKPSVVAQFDEAGELIILRH